MDIRIIEKGDTFELNGRDAETASKVTGTKIKDLASPVLFFNRQTIPSAMSQLIALGYSIHFYSPSGSLIRKVNYVYMYH